MSREALSYRTSAGHVVFVAEGLEPGLWGAFWRSDRGGLHRVKSANLPMVSDRDRAQANLDEWARKHGFEIVLPPLLISRPQPQGETP
jgi:hypothetical protein